MISTSLIIGGVYNVISALFHLGFWKMFDWHEELSRLNQINRGIMQTLNIVLIYVFLGAAILSFYLAGSPDALAGLERALLGFIGGIYLVRAAVQFPLFGVAPLGRGLAIMGMCVFAGGGYILVALGSGGA